MPTNMQPCTNTSIRALETTGSSKDNSSGKDNNNNGKGNSNNNSGKGNNNSSSGKDNSNSSNSSNSGGDSRRKLLNRACKKITNVPWMSYSHLPWVYEGSENENRTVKSIDMIML